MVNVPNGEKKPDYSDRLKRQRTASTIKFYVIAIVLGALLGLAYIQRAAIISVYNSVMAPPPPPPAPPAPVAPAAAEPERKIVEKSAVKALRGNQDAAAAIPPAKAGSAIAEQAISPKDELTARKILADGKALMETFDLTGASKRFDEATKLKIGTALKDDAVVWKQKAEAFMNATRHIGLADYAQSENAVVVETTDGSEWRGLKVKEDDDTIYLQAVNDANPAAEGVQKFPIPKAEIKKMTPVPLARRKGDFSELVLGTESATVISHSSDYYDLIYLSKRLGLGKECMMYLNRAFDGGPGHAPDPDLGDTLRRVVIRRAISRATLLMAGNRRVHVEIELKKLRDTLPGFGPAEEEIAAFRSQVMAKVSADFQPSLVVNEKKADTKKVATADKDKSKGKQPVRESEIEIGVDNSKLKSNGPGAKYVDRGNAKFEEGMGIIRTYTVGVGGNKNDNNRILLQAKALLMEAIDSYEEALKVESSNRAVRDRQTTASQMVYFCNKNMIL